MDWNILGKLSDKKLSPEEVIERILDIRGVRGNQNKNIFLNPPKPETIKPKDLGINIKEIEKAKKRLEKAFHEKEEIVVYGDYDADGICATAVIWEEMYKKGYSIMPYIPKRFEEGYGINAESVKDIHGKNPKTKVIITVDNGIVAEKGIDMANKLGIDVVIIDHHQKAKILPKAHAVIFTDKICGSALAYVFVNQLLGKTLSSLDLVAIGTIADQMPLTDENRAFVKHGLVALNKTQRPGLKSLYQEAGIAKVGTYEVGYFIAPRLNATGRLTHGLESLRLLCTKDIKRAGELSKHLGSINKERQDIVEKVQSYAQKEAEKTKDLVIVVADENYHEGVIGLAAGRIAEKFFRPAIVMSINGKISKGSARSIPGFNIIKNIKKLSSYIIEGGGHPMAAGFSIETKNIDIFRKKINELAKKEITKNMLKKKLNIDLILEFTDITKKLFDEIEKLEPFGMGNPTPSFATYEVKVLEEKKVGSDKKHTKLKLKKDNIVFDAIYFNTPKDLKLEKDKNINIAYQLTENTWSGRGKIELRIRDINTI